MSDVTLHLGDCLEVMKGLPAGSVDAVVTDPPYGNGKSYSSYQDTQERLRELIDSFMPEVLRISERVLLTCGVPNMWLYPPPTWVLNWTDPAGEGGCKWGFPSWQPILAYGKDPFLQRGLGRRSDTIVKRFLREKDIDHPCPKPVGIMRWIIERATFPGDTILDPFMGSGTTGVACVQTKRNFIGIEIDPGYYAIAEKRIQDARRQMPMELA